MKKITNTEKELKEYLSVIGITKNKTKYFCDVLILHYNKIKEYKYIEMLLNKEQIESVNNILKAGQRNEKINQLFS